MCMGFFALRRFGFLWVCLVLAAAVTVVGAFSAPKEKAAAAGAPAKAAPGFLDGVSVGPPSAERELVGLWVPYLSLGGTGGQAAFEDRFQHIAQTAADIGVNALFVHVRPFCDALYPSEVYPWSHLLTGTQGQDPGFDPLAYMVDCTHRYGMEFHAWINPLRVRTEQTPSVLSADNPYQVLDYPGYFLETGGAVYLNPAYDYVRALVAQGAAEIVEKYDVEGIHFDDYFYPAGGPEMDADAYSAYLETVETPLPLEEWRCANISALVQEVYLAVKSANPQAVFGIAPQGNLQNDWNMGADVAAWCATPGYVDYVCPQLYYSFDNPALGFEEALEDWLALSRCPEVQLYAGLALYKAGTDADGGTWLGQNDVLAREITRARSAACSGVVLYAYDALESETAAAELENAVAVLAPADSGP